MYIAQYCLYNSPIGNLLLAGLGDTLLYLGLPQGKLKYSIRPEWQLQPDCFSLQRQQLAEYLAGVRQTFDFPYALCASAFQTKVLSAVEKIPYGHTSSYSQIALQIQQPEAVRAVGGANATNPLPIIIPCHRVVGKRGSLTGFGGGLELKMTLLRLEKASAE